MTLVLCPQPLDSVTPRFMNKALLKQQIVLALEALHQSAVKAAQEAHSAAIHDETIAENKYDTTGLEASYLAQGQQKRQAECEADLNTLKTLQPTEFTAETPITIGALIELINLQNEDHQWLFLSPAAGGLKFSYEDKEITLITPSSPLGNALLNCYSGDEISLNIARSNEEFTINLVY